VSSIYLSAFVPVYNVNFTGIMAIISVLLVQSENVLLQITTPTMQKCYIIKVGGEGFQHLEEVGILRDFNISFVSDLLSNAFFRPGMPPNRWRLGL